MKRVVSLLLAMVMAMGLVACTSEPKAEEAPVKEAATGEAAEEAPAEEEKDLIVVGYANTGGSYDWRKANIESFANTFTEENGYVLIADDAQEKQENQVKAIRNFIQQGVDYIVLAPVVQTGWETVLGEAKDAGIPVIISDRDIVVSDDTLFTAFVGSDFYQEGINAMDWLVNYLDEQGRGDEQINMVMLQGPTGASAEIGRTAAVEDFVAENSDRFTLLAKQNAEWSESKGQEVMESFLKAHDDIDVLVSQNDDMARGAVTAIEAVGLDAGKDIIVISFDAVRSALEAVIAGNFNLTAECNPLHGPRVKELIEKLEAGEEVDKLSYVEEELFDITNSEAALPNRTY